MEDVAYWWVQASMVSSSVYTSSLTAGSGSAPAAAPILRSAQDAFARDAAAGGTPSSAGAGSGSGAGSAPACSSTHASRAITACDTFWLTVSASFDSCAGHPKQSLKKATCCNKCVVEERIRSLIEKFLNENEFGSGALIEKA